MASSENRNQVGPSSNVWISPDAPNVLRRQEKQRYCDIRRQATRFGYMKSPVMPSRFQDYLQHRYEILEEQIEASRKAIALRSEEQNLRKSRPDLPEISEAFAGRQLPNIDPPPIDNYNLWRLRWAQTASAENEDEFTYNLVLEDDPLTQLWLGNQLLDEL